MKIKNITFTGLAPIFLEVKCQKQKNEIGDQ